MSENIEKELEELKTYLINEYKTNGGTKDVSSFSAAMITNEIDNLKRLNAMKKELEELKTNKTPAPKVGAIDPSRENAFLASKAAAGVVGAYMDHINPPFDMRSLEDERYARDNALVKLGVPNSDPSVCIIRDEEGRLA